MYIGEVDIHPYNPDGFRVSANLAYLFIELIKISIPLIIGIIIFAIIYSNWKKKTDKEEDERLKKEQAEKERQFRQSNPGKLIGNTNLIKQQPVNYSNNQHTFNNNHNSNVNINHSNNINRNGTSSMLSQSELEQIQINQLKKINQRKGK